MSDNASGSSAFLEMYLAGKLSADDIDDYIDEWHRDPRGKQIFEYLGMTRDEYSSWVRDPEILPEIAAARRKHPQPLGRKKA